MPFGVKETLTYVGWLLDSRRVQSASIENYLAGIRVAHMKAGHSVPVLRPDIVQSILRGAANKDELTKKLLGKPPRLCMTITKMELLKCQISMSNMTLSKKRLMWLVSTLCFNGSFRIHEICSREKNTFDPTACLLWSDIKLEKMTQHDSTTRVLKIHLRNPKEQKLAQGVTVELFETGNFLCPVNAYLKWKTCARVHLSKGKPAIRLDSGENYTGKEFNRDLRQLLSPYVNYQKGTISSHSFRSGLASLMATLGYSDLDIMTIGRWKSEVKGMALVSIYLSLTLRHS